MIAFKERILRSSLEGFLSFKDCEALLMWASGPLDFDKSRELRSDFAFYCTQQIWLNCNFNSAKLPANALWEASHFLNIVSYFFTPAEQLDFLTKRSE